MTEENTNPGYGWQLLMRSIQGNVAADMVPQHSATRVHRGFSGVTAPATQKTPKRSFVQRSPDLPLPPPQVSARLSVLNEEQRQILACLLVMPTQSVIAQALGGSIGDLVYPIATMKKKLGVNSIEQLIRIGIDEGWASLPPREEWQKIVDIHDGFTDQQKEILQSLSEGKTLQTIARDINMRMPVLTLQQKMIKQRLGLSSTLGLVTAVAVLDLARSEHMEPSLPKSEGGLERLGALLSDQERQTIKTIFTLPDLNGFMRALPSELSRHWPVVKHKLGIKHVNTLIKNSVEGGWVPLPPVEQRSAILEAYKKFSPIQQMVVHKLIEGASFAAISTHTNIPAYNVQPYIEHITQNLGARSVGELISALRLLDSVLKEKQAGHGMAHTESLTDRRFEFAEPAARWR